MTKTRLLAAVACAAALAALPAASQTRTATALFAGGCFWTVEHKFEAVPGVVNVVSGYSGGRVANPSYDLVNTETTGHKESVKVTYDPSKISYRKLVDYYYRMIDPTDADGQVCDKAESYQSFIFWGTEQEKADAQAATAAVNDGPRKGRIAVKLQKAGAFYPAEGYHQDYAKKNPQAYERYRVGCGRDRVLERIWADKPALPTEKH